MSSPNTLGDPRSGRDRRVPTKTHTFKHGHLDPVINNKRPLFTIGNGILLAVMIGYGLYATGNLPQLDAFFAHADAVGKAHNNVVVSALITYGTYLFGAVLLGVFGLVVFLFLNTHRRRASDPKGWHKVADAPPERRRTERRADAPDMPSMVMPLGKIRPSRRAADAPVAAVAETTAPQARQIVKTVPAATLPIAAAVASVPTPPAPIAVAASAPIPEKVDPAKAAAIAAAAKAEATLASAPADLPSFVMPFGKTPKKNLDAPLGTRTMQPATPAPLPVVSPAMAATAIPASPSADISLLPPSVANAQVEAAIAAARAVAAKADAAVAAAKAEAAIATARAEAAIAEATIAAARAQTLAN